METIQFEKYEAAGNDFVVVDIRDDASLHDICVRHAARICDRHFGIGADGILLVTPRTAETDAGMIVVNADGSIAEMCGNGIRCVAKYLLEHGQSIQDGILRIGSGAGIQTIRCHAEGLFDVEMARVILKDAVSVRQGERVWHGRIVDVGNPHAVFEIDDSPNDALAQAGAFLSNHEVFPHKSNIEFIRMRGENTVDMTVYERGVGPTLACGTGCVAAAVAFAHAHDMSEGDITLHLPGGIIKVIIRREAVRLRGGANHVFSGEYRV